MRGKLVVLLMLASAGALLAYSLWFVSNHTPVDERFNMRRRPLADDTPGGLILKERAGDYERISLEVDTLDVPGAARHGKATYRDFEGKVIQLEVQLVRDQQDQQMDIARLFQDFAARAGGDLQNSVIRLHPESRTPYGFGAYAGPTYTYYEFTWINQNWVIRVSTREAGSESLLRFANSYSF